MWWVMAYFAIGFGCLLIGLWQDRHIGLPLCVALALFLLWPYVLPRGIWQAHQQIKRNKER